MEARLPGRLLDDGEDTVKATMRSTTTTMVVIFPVSSFSPLTRKLEQKRLEIYVCASE
jgi:hypothetical protein